MRRYAEHGFTPVRRYAEHGFTPVRRYAEHGFTLVELMIVLVIVGLMSAVVILTMPDPRGRLVTEAERFAARVAVARDGAIIDGRETSLIIDPLGYGFEERRRGEWRPLQQRALARTEWPQGTRVTIGRDSRKTIIFDTTGLLSEPATVTLRREGEEVAIAIGQDGTVNVGS
ncbi:GspH/FimT family pseudopilin [Sphingomonas sp. LaA6.9]|uniref:GspH/FimT family pseudopilin n=1 Tax=Sphingomonas sp. LaA6.9 TaxID=2919914 RepID=UPI001F4F6450|nr:GspH/FimT family pseudopilin [Sphingomonas sp. LaA6.9]MCJ8157593.1 GspH/FimT family pseudopilin [Sphingomonas sp. LaA6.9]